MDVLNYENAVNAYNNLEAFQTEKQQQIRDLVQQYRQGAEQTILPAIELYQRGKSLYNKFTGETPTSEGAITEGEGAVEGASNTLGSLGENVMSEVSSRLGQFSSSVRGIGNQLSDRMMSNAFERDPEAELASGEENMGIFDRAQSLFRGGVSDVASTAESATTEAVSSAAEGVGAAIGESIGTIASEAVPVIGELGMLGLGIYDFIKGETTKAPVIEAYAAPVLEKGV